MAKTRKSKTPSSKPNETSQKNTQITKAKQQVNKNAKVVQSVRRSARLNRLNFGDMSFDLQSKIGWEVLANFPLAQQLKMRTISPVWDYNVQLACKQIHSLVLYIDRTLTDPEEEIGCSCVSKFEENLKRFPVINKAELTINVKQSTIEPLGKLFGNVEHLTIYYTVDCENNELLFNLLQYFPKVTAFSLTVTAKIANNRNYFTNQLFTAINNHLAPSLTSLHLHLDFVCYLRVNVNILNKTLPFLQNLHLCCPIENPHKILEMMGKSLQPNQFPIQSLVFGVEKLEMSTIESVFKHNPQLAKIKRLELNYVENQAVAQSFLDHFTELEYLEICAVAQINKVNDYSLEWMEKIAKLTSLNELALHGMHPKNFDFEVPVTISTVRRLTFYYSEFLKSISKDWDMANEAFFETQASQNQIMKEFVVNFAKQYPNLEELTVEWHDCDEQDDARFRELCLAEFGHLKNVQFYDYVDPTITFCETPTFANYH